MTEEIKELECNNYTCGRREARDEHIPAGWFLVKESYGDGEYQESHYCSHECLLKVENDD